MLFLVSGSSGWLLVGLWFGLRSNSAAVIVVGYVLYNLG